MPQPAGASIKRPSWHHAMPGPGVPSLGAAPVAVDAKLVVSGDITRLSIDLSAPTTLHAALTENPDRLVIDLPEINFQLDSAAGRPEPQGSGSVRAFRFGLVGPGRSRVVLDLASPAAVRRAEVVSIAGGDPSRLVVELAPTDRASFHEAVRAGSAAAVPAAPARPNLDATPGRTTLVIDPGHGGIDPGASGLGGVLEKDVVLAFSAALAARLSADGRYRVVLTRHDDSFVSLDDRLRIARDSDAALLLSVHADSLADGSVAGATVYTSSDRASDAEAARVAADENRADALAGAAEPAAPPDVSDILFDFARRETRTYAHQFQHTLTGYWAKVAHLNRNPERSAGFKVLQAPDVPSVLLELGYLSSGDDSRSLSSPAWRTRVADGVAAAVDAFFAGRVPPRAPGAATEAVPATPAPDGARQAATR